ncbi:hypothetical protein HG531_003417 [Fusarium graminearum]|nr:hypothetical protein HG531_003417 [Fusarium graminearum]
MASDATEALTGTNDHQTKLPAVDNSHETAGNQVENGNENEGNVKAHQFQNRLRVGVNTTSQSTSAVFLTIEKLEILSKHILQTLLAKLVAKELGDSVGGIAKNKASCKNEEVRPCYLGAFYNESIDDMEDAQLLVVVVVAKFLTGLEALLDLHNEVVSKSHFSSLFDSLHLFLNWCIFPLGANQTMLDVIEYGSFEQNRFLLDQANISSEPVQVQLVNGTAVEFDSTRLGVVPTLNKTNNSTLSRSRLAYQGGDLASRNIEGEIVKHGNAWSRGVGKSDVFQLYVPDSLGWGLACLGKRVDSRFAIDESEELGCSGHGTAKVDGVRGELGQLHSCDNNRKKNCEDNTRIGDLTTCQHTDTLPES